MPEEIRWNALESNPVCFNKILSDVGISSLRVLDVYAFENSSFEKLPVALLLCFSNYDQARDILEEQYKDAAMHGVKASEGIFMVHQKIENACGTFALFNALANLEGNVDIGSGEFKKWLEEAKKVGSEERSALIQNNKIIEAAHDAAAKIGETDIEEEVDNHFIAYINKDNTIYEIDSRALFPRSVGKTTEVEFLPDAGAIIRNFMEKLNSSTFAVMALCPV